MKRSGSMPSPCLSSLWMPNLLCLQLALSSLALAQDHVPESRDLRAEPMASFNIVDFGAIGDGQTLNTDAITRTISACVEAGGGVVVVSPGIYVSGPLHLRSQVTLHLQAGAVLQGSGRLEDYPEETERGWGEGSGESVRAGLITARDAERVAIVGRGVIDGNAMAFHDPSKLHGRIVKTYTRQGDQYMDPRFGTEHGPIAHGRRPGNLLRFFDCRDVVLRSVTIQNSPTWTIQFNGCVEVDVLGVNINSHASQRRVPNDDGIDIFNSKRVHIANCDIQTGDDCIALFGGEAVTVNNCTLASRSSGLRIGYVGGDIRNCIYNNLIIDSNRGISIFVRGQDSIEDISFSNIIIRSKLVTGHWWGQAEPIHISAVPWDPNARKLGTIDNIRFVNISAESDSGIVVHGSTNSLVRNVHLENLSLKLTNGPLQPAYGGNFDLRAAADITRGVFAQDIPALYCRYAEGIRISGLRVTWDDRMPAFFNHAIQIEDARNVSIGDFEGRQPHTSGETVSLRRVTGISIRSSRAGKGTDAFVGHTDVSEARVFADNDLFDAKTVFRPAGLEFIMSDYVDSREEP